MMKRGIDHSFALRTRGHFQRAVSAFLCVLWIIFALQGETRARKKTRAKTRVARVERLAVEGMLLYKKGAFKRALLKFKAAFRLYALPNLLYNMGRCYQALGRVEAAIIYFERCADHPKITWKIRENALKKKEMLVKIKAKTIAEAAAARRKRQAAARRGGLDARQGSASRPHWAFGVGKWASAGASFAMLTAGTVFLALGASDNNAIKDAKNEGATSGAAPITLAEAQDLQDSARTKITLGYAFMGVSAAFAITSALLFVLNRGSEDASSASDAKHSRFMATPLKGGAALSLEGLF